MADRKVHVTLSADVEAYVEAMKRARKATKKLGREIIKYDGRTWRLSMVIEGKNLLSFKYELLTDE